MSNPALGVITDMTYRCHVMPDMIHMEREQNKDGQAVQDKGE